MKIILVTRSAITGGIEEHVSQLARHLVGQKRDVLWVVLSKKNMNQKLKKIPGVHFLLLNDKESQSFRSFLLLGRLLQIVWRFRPHVVHLHGIRPMILFSLIPFPLFTRRICTIHASYLLMAMDGYGKIVPWKRLLSAIFHIFSCFRSQCIITVSRYLADEIQNLISPLRIKNIHVVHNGVDCDCTSFNAALPEIICKSFHSDELQVVFTGRLEDKKGIGLIINAFSTLNSSLKIRCHMIGDGYQRVMFENLAKEKNINDRIHFWGNINEIGKKIKMFDVFILPSYSEGMPLSILEAMAAGLPVIASQVGGIPEAVIDNVTGYLIHTGDYLELAEKLEILYRDKEKRKIFGKAGCDRVREFFDLKIQLISTIAHY